MLVTTVVLVSEDSSVIEMVHAVLGSVGQLRLRVASELDEAEELIGRHETALAVLHLAGERGLAEADRLNRRLASATKPVPLIVLTDRDEPEETLALLRLGVADCLSVPLERGRLATVIDLLTVRARVTAAQAAVAEPADLRRVDDREPFLYLTGSRMGRMMEQVQMAAPRETTILLGGETGTGKTRLARLIHESSPRKGEPFLVINCGALSASLIESEMFGHIKGSFTGADRDRTGKFAEVGRGTLFLDEIDALPPALQAKLLRVVEERVFEPVGSNKSQAMRARLIVASNRALDQEVAAGRFRADLFYRLNVVGFHMPPLRERREVIRPMAEQFVRQFAAHNPRGDLAISGMALRLLESYDWPGNIRELRNVIERAVALCDGETIGRDDLPDAIRLGEPLAMLASMDLSLDVLPMAPSWSASPPQPAVRPAAATLAQAKVEAEAARISEALHRHGNNRLRAALELGISRMTLYKKIHKYGLVVT